LDLRGGFPTMFESRDSQAEEARYEDPAQGADQSYPRISHAAISISGGNRLRR
jgi:hypothetical protein